METTPTLPPPVAEKARIVENAFKIPRMINNFLLSKISCVKFLFLKNKIGNKPIITKIFSIKRTKVVFYGKLMLYFQITTFKGGRKATIRVSIGPRATRG